MVVPRKKVHIHPPPGTQPQTTSPGPTDRSEGRPHEHRHHRRPRRRPSRRAEPPREAQRDEPGAAASSSAAPCARPATITPCTASCCAARAPCSPPAWTSASSPPSPANPASCVHSATCSSTAPTSANRWPSRSSVRSTAPASAARWRSRSAATCASPPTTPSSACPEVKFGIIPDVGGSTRLPAVVGLGRAKELIMTGATIDAAEAERIGLVNRVVPAERAGGGHPGARGRAARELPHRRRPRQARDRRLGPPRTRADARDGGLGAGVLRGGDAGCGARG